MPLTQTVTVFFSTFCLVAAINVARERSGKWFESDLIGACHRIANQQQPRGIPVCSAAFCSLFHETVPRESGPDGRFFSTGGDKQTSVRRMPAWAIGKLLQKFRSCRAALLVWT